jgi:hypothetical protein
MSSLNFAAFLASILIPLRYVSSFTFFFSPSYPFYFLCSSFIPLPFRFISPYLKTLSFLPYFLVLPFGFYFYLHIFLLFILRLSLCFLCVLFSPFFKFFPSFLSFLLVFPFVLVLSSSLSFVYSPSFLLLPFCFISPYLQFLYFVCSPSSLVLPFCIILIFSFLVCFSPSCLLPFCFISPLSS